MSWPCPSNVAARFARGGVALGLALGASLACRSQATDGAAPSASAPPFVPARVEARDAAMGTKLHVIAYTTPGLDRAGVEQAIRGAFEEVRRLEGLLSEWDPRSEISRANLAAGEPAPVGPELFAVLEKSLWAGRVSEGTFDVTFETMSDLWRFGSAAERDPKPPSAEAVAKRRALVDYRLVVLDASSRSVTVPAGRRVGLGGIAKGYIVDRAAERLRRAGVRAFLFQAGGDLYGAGRKPDGTAWVSGIQDPRGPSDRFFAVIELEDHAFSTAGDYARSFVHDGRRYHHILDPRTGFPATSSRSVTVWAPDAFTADALDDAIFVLGPEKGLALAESVEGVGCVVVDAKNSVHVSRRLEGRVKLLAPPSDAP